MSASRYLGLTAASPIVGTPGFAAAEDRFYRGIRTSGGAFKTTERRRLDAINALFFDVLAQGHVAPGTIMDIGVSSGITTLEWLEEFRRRRMTARMIATDLTMSVYLADLGGGLRVLLEPDGHILQIELFGRAVRSWYRRRDFATGGVVWRMALLRLVRRRLATVPRRTWRGPYRFVTPALRDQADIALLDDDITAPTPPDRAAAADVIRLANIVQPGYFNPAQIAEIVTHVRERCRGPGSLVIVSRNREHMVEASILRLAGDQSFALAARLNGGSEVERYFTTPG